MVIFRIINESMSAEALKNFSHLIALRYEECKNTGGCLVVSKDVEVYITEDESIPIKWIKQYIEDNTQVIVNPKYEDTEFTGDPPIDYYNKVYPYQVKTMLESWRKENDKMSEM